MHKIEWFATVCALLLVSPSAFRIEGQVPHLPPFYRPVVERGEVLSIGLTPAAAAAAKTVRVQVDDDRLVITNGNDQVDVIPLGDRTIRDVIAEVRLKYSDLLVLRSDYPLYSTDVIGAMDTSVLPLAGMLPVPPAAATPQVDLGFGAMLSMPGADDEVGSGLLSQTGFQLDLAGSFQLLGRGQPVNGNGAGWRAGWLDVPAVQLRGRLGLSADQQLQVENADQNIAPTVDQQYGVALEQADQVALGGQLDFVVPLRPGRWDFVVTPHFAVSWTQLEAVPLPTTIRVGTESLPFSEVFSQDAIRRALRQSRETLPLSEWGLVGNFQFSRMGPPVFYFGGGVMRREFVKRGFRFRPVNGPGTAPDPESLEAAMETPTDNVWRAMFGARVAGVLDVRLDASGPIGDRDREPLLRIILGRAFPIVQ